MRPEPVLVGHTAPLLIPLGRAAIRHHDRHAFPRARGTDPTRIRVAGGFARGGEDVAGPAAGAAVAGEDGGAACCGGDHAAIIGGGGVVAVLPGAGAAAGARGRAGEGTVLLLRKERVSWRGAVRRGGKLTVVVARALPPVLPPLVLALALSMVAGWAVPELEPVVLESLVFADVVVSEPVVPEPVVPVVEPPPVAPDPLADEVPLGLVTTPAANLPAGTTAGVVPVELVFSSSSSVSQVPSLSSSASSSSLLPTVPKDVTPLGRLEEEGEETAGLTPNLEPVPDPVDPVDVELVPLLDPLDTEPEPELELEPLPWRHWE